MGLFKKNKQERQEQSDYENKQKEKIDEQKVEEEEIEPSESFYDEVIGLINKYSGIDTVDGIISDLTIAIKDLTKIELKDEIKADIINELTKDLDDQNDTSSTK